MAKVEIPSGNKNNRAQGRGRHGGLITYRYGDYVMVVSFDQNGKTRKRMEKREQ